MFKSNNYKNEKSKSIKKIKLMIEELSKKDKIWRTIAFKICKDKTLADDIVQEMYLNLYNCTKQINDFYVIITMKNIFLHWIKKENKLISIDNYDFADSKINLELDDSEKIVIDSLKPYEKELIELTYEKSFRQIQKEYHINYQFTRKLLNKTKEKLCQERKKYN